MDKHDWEGCHILHPHHSAELEQAAAMHEFASGMPRKEAEEKAYQSYRKTQHEHAAAHHLRGLKSAYGSGDREDAKKHAVLYELHMKKLGHEPWRAVPPEIALHLDNPLKEKVHKFRPTGADSFVLDEHKAKEKEDK